MPTHSKEKQKREHESNKHPGGPLKRKGAPAEDFTDTIGPSLDSIPGSQLTLVREVLQRYRALRIN